MKTQRIVRTAATVLMLGFFVGSTPGSAEVRNLEGLWLGYGSAEGLGGATFAITFSHHSFGLTARMNIPALGLVDEDIPATVDDSSGDTIVTIDVPGIIQMSGTVNGNIITGGLDVVYGGGTLPGSWYVEKDTGEVFLPGAAPGPACPDLPPPHCAGSAEHCSELMAFLPEEGPGYLNYPLNGETWEDQYRSYLRRDLMQIVKYAAARVACSAADWDYGNGEPLGLGDMSEADGSIPGTSDGNPGHPPGTHENGKDIDIAYYQLFAEDNKLRPVGVHQPGPFQDAFHLLGPPYALDVWRTALFVAALFEHPRMRVVGVDGQIGPVMEDALDYLVAYGWIEYELRESITLGYEVVDMGYGWFLFHHHHMHLSLRPVEDLVATAAVRPYAIDPTISGRYVTVYVELEENLNPSLIDVDTVGVILGGEAILFAEPWSATLGDFNHNGIEDLAVRINRQALLNSTTPGFVEITIVGQVDERFFQEVDTVIVLSESMDQNNNPAD